MLHLYVMTEEFIDLQGYTGIKERKEHAYAFSH